MVNSLTLYPLGVGDFGATTLFHTSFLLQADGQRLAVDCPRRFAGMLAFNAECSEQTVGINDYQSILLTHLHIDHAGGLVELAEAGLLQEEKRIKLYAPAPLLDYLWSDQVERGVVSAAAIDGGRAMLARCFEPVALDNPHTIGGFRVHYRPTQHIPNTYAYLLDFGNFTLGYSADTAFDAALIDWLDQADLVLHDVTWPPWWDDVEMVKLHPPLAKLLELPQAFQQKTLLCHYDDRSFREQAIGHYRYLEQNRLYHLVQ